MKLINRSNGKHDKGIRRASNPLSRMIGLLLTNPKKDPRGLWLVPCGSIHTMGMRHPIDVLFLDRELKVLKIKHRVKPFCPAVVCLKAHSVLEFFSGFWDTSLVKAGDQLEIKEE